MFTENITRHDLRAISLLVGICVWGTLCHADITTGLVAQYDFEDQVNLGNDIVGTFDGTPMAATGGTLSVTHVTGAQVKIGSGSISISNDSALALPKLSSMGLTTIGTIAMWINPTSQHYASGWMAVPFAAGSANFQNYTIYDASEFPGGAPAGYFHYFDLWGSAGDIAFNDTIDAPRPDLSFAGAWHHHAVVYDGTNTSLYLDGQLIVSAPTVFPDLSALDTDQTFIGNVADGPGNTTPKPGWGTNAVYDDVRIYTRALSAQDLIELVDWGTVPVTLSEFATEYLELE